MKNRIDFCFLGLIFLAVVYITACSGDDTGVEVMFDPEVEVTQGLEPVEEVTPELIVETVDVPTLESWGIEDGELEIVNGNCNLPIFKKAPFPRAPAMEEIRAESGAVLGGGPECRDNDPEGSFIDVNCVRDHDIKNGNFYVCINQEDCDFVVENNDRIDYCKVQPGDPFNVPSGKTNIYDDLFKRSGFYLNTRGEEQIFYGRRSFIMVKTHRGGSLRNPSGDAGAGKLYGKYNPDSGEYKDRKRLWDECGIGTDPQIGSEKESDWKENGINGEWQARKRDDGFGLEICIRLDTLPGAVKCFVDDPSGPYVELHTRDNSPKIVVDTNEMDERSTSLTLSIFGNSDFRRNKLCELFDEG